MSKVDVPQSETLETKAQDALQRLISEQGVKAIEDVDQLAALWPADDDPDRLMSFLLTERQERVKLGSEKQ